MLNRKLFFGAVSGLILLILAACDGAAQPTATPVVIAATPTVISTPPRPTAPAGWDARITYEVTGGIEGVKRTLMVGPAGQARLVEGSKNSGPVRLTAERLVQLKSKLDAARFFDLKEQYGTGTVSDDFILTLSLTQDGQTKTVVVEEIGGQGATPQALLDLISNLEALRGEIEAGSMPTATPQASASPTTPTTPTTATSPTSSPAGWNARLSYSKSGGIMGLTQRLEIDTQGNAIFSERDVVLSEGSISPQNLAQITSRLDAARFFSLQESYGIAVPDGFVYAIMVTQGGRMKTVTMAHREGNIPAEVRGLFEEVERVAEDMRARVTPKGTPTVLGRWDGTLVYERTGGFAHPNRTLKISPDGQATFTEADVDAGPLPLTTERLAQLQAKLDAARFFDLNDAYGTAADDGFVVTITLSQGGRTKAVTISQGNNDDVPVELSNLLVEVTGLAEEVKGMVTPIATP